MNTVIKEFKNSDGSISTISISSDDNYRVNLAKSYKISNNNYTKYTKKSIFLADIGVNSGGFVSSVLLAFLLAILAFGLMYIYFRV